MKQPDCQCNHHWFKCPYCKMKVFGKHMLWAHLEVAHEYEARALKEAEGPA